MGQVIQISGATGTPPYDVYICDTTLTYCDLISGGTSISPFLEYTLSGIYEGATPIIIKIIDSLGCEFFKIFTCPTTTTTTTSTTTTTTLSPCSCISFEYTGVTSSTFSFTDCDGLPFNGNIYPGFTLFYCGSSPSGGTEVITVISGTCVSNSCPWII